MSVYNLEPIFDVRGKARCIAAYGHNTGERHSGAECPAILPVRSHKMSNKIQSATQIASQQWPEGTVFIPVTPDILHDVEQAYLKAEEIADGWSNDDEIDAWRDATDEALSALGMSRP